jgi:carbon monoxide dehydrogenase subunit G
MKTKLYLTVASAILLLLSACGMAVVPGSGEIANETRDVHGYSKVVFSAPGELTIEQNGDDGLVIEGDDNLLGYIQTHVQGNVLYIEVEPNMIQMYPSRPIRYSLDMDALTSVTLNGSGDIRSDELIASNLDFDLNGSGRILINAVKSQATKLDLNGSGQYRFDSLMTGQFAISLNGSGDIFMQETIAKTVDVEIDGSGTLNAKDVIANTLNMIINGSGTSTLAGEVNQQTVALHGSGNYQARDLQSQVTEVKIIGSGNSNVWVTDELGITIAGSGDVIYRGHPLISQMITGSGDLINLAKQ